MAALASIDDLAKVMRRGLDAGDRVRATRLLEIASQRVRTFVGLEFTEATTTVTVPVRNRRARLPQRPVTAVAAVTDPNDNPVAYEWNGRQVVDLAPAVLNEFELNMWRTGLRSVKVTYTHGWAPIPDDVVGIVCDMVAAALDSPPEDVGIQSETIGPYSISTGSQYPGGVRLTQSMKDALLPYMQPAGTASVS